MNRIFQERVGGIRFLIPAVVAALLLLPGELPAAGDVAVSPTRVVFEGGERKARVSLLNRGSETKTYRIELVRKRMTESGEYQDVHEPKAGELFSDRMIRFSPRQVVLPPGKPQLVRLLLRRPADLADGEYRSWLRFTAIPSGDEQGVESILRQGDREMSIRLIPVMSISIPIIVRQGNISAEVAISDLEFQAGVQGGREAVLSLLFQRSGERSLYGDVTVYFTPRDGEPVVVGQANGVSVYPPAPRRRFRLPLHPPQGVRLSGGELHVVYRGHGASGDAPPLAEGRVALP